MKIYVLYGKWHTFRNGVDVNVERRILFLPNKNLRFSVDDREIRNLSKLEKKSLDYLVSRIDSSKTKVSYGSYTYNRLKLVEREINNKTYNKIMKAYTIQDRNFFFEEHSLNL